MHDRYKFKSYNIVRTFSIYLFNDIILMNILGCYYLTINIVFNVMIV